MFICCYLGVTAKKIHYVILTVSEITSFDETKIEMSKKRGRNQTAA